MRILNAKQMREADRRTIEEIGIASRCFCDSGPRGGQETFIDPGLAKASMTIERS